MGQPAPIGQARHRWDLLSSDATGRRDSDLPSGGGGPCSSSERVNLSNRQSEPASAVERAWPSLVTDPMVNSQVLCNSYGLQEHRLPLWITLVKLDSHGGVAQW